MSSSWGDNLRISIFGESHGPAIGVVIDGLPPGIPLNEERIARFMARRAPGKQSYSTPRKEADLPQIQSGYRDGRTTGTPLCAVIANTNTRSGDYKDMETLARPGHADYTGHLRYRGFGDIRGGGHFSARLTAPLVFAGAVAKEALALGGVAVGAHIATVRHIADEAPDSLALTPAMLEAVAAKDFPVFDDSQGEGMRQVIDAARRDLDSVGGTVACFALGMPAGVGSPLFGGLENRIASLVFGIPAVKGLEFGLGFAATELLGSENNDAFYMRGDRVETRTNHHGGILGGISSGMPITLRVAFKPTPSIGKPQQTVDYLRNTDAEIAVRGRHDPCIVPRAVPCVEACVALALLDSMLEGGAPIGFGSVAPGN